MEMTAAAVETMAVETTDRMMAIVGAGMNSDRSLVLNRDLLCSTRVQAADVTNRKITTATDKVNRTTWLIKHLKIEK